MVASRFHVLLLFWSAAIPALAQSTISGRITDEANSPLEGISVTLHPPYDPAILAFFITGADGKFTLSFNANQDSLRIKAYGLGWATNEKPLPNRTQVVNLTLVSQPIALREVKVKPPPIVQDGDTISYSVDAFKSQSDRVIADVIKKLPGIEVEADGRILYQGKPINKYYIEGLDLLNSKYRLANDNLPADAVARVQVIENHQPIRMLDSLVYSDRAALNIRLKKGITTTGSAHLGAGAAPLLWDANMTPMLFSRNNQMIASLQSNNTGDNVSAQLKDMAVGTVFNPLQNDRDKKDWLAIQPLAVPPFATNRWLDNRVLVGTANYLKRLGNDLELRGNVAYNNDYQRQRGSTFTRYFTPTDTIEVLEKKYNQLLFNSLEATLTLQKNSKKKYFKNELNARGNWDNQQGFIALNGTPLNQDLSNPFFWLSNKFTDIFKAGKQLITLESNTTLSRTPQSLAVSPGQFAGLINQGGAYDGLYQRVSATSFTSENFISLTKKSGYFTLVPQIGVDFERQKLDSDLSISDGETEQSLPAAFTNNLDWQKLNAYVKLKTQYSRDAWRIVLDSPLNYYKFDIEDKTARKGQRLSKIIFEPRLSVNYQIGSFWTARGGMNYANRFGTIDNVSYGYLLKNYRVLQRRNTPLQSTRTVSGNISLDYRNPLTSVFGGLNYIYSSSRNNLLFRSAIGATGTTEYTAIEQTNYGYLQALSGRLGKYFPAIKTNVGTNVSFTKTESEQLLNGTLTTISNNSFNPGLTVSTNFNKIMDVGYGLTLSAFKSKLVGKEQSTFQRKQSLTLNVYPSKTYFFIAENEYYVSNFTTGLTRNLFTSLSFRYAFPKKKIVLETKWSNVWNTSTYAISSISSYSYIESVYELRPMQIVQKVRFSF